MSSCEKQGLEAVLQSGFFFLGDDVKAVQNGTLPLADLEQTPCRNPEACVLDPSGLAMRCAEGYTGPLCAVCDENFGAGSDFTCAKCMSPAAAWVLLTLLLITIGCAFTFGVFRILRRSSDLGGKPKRKVLVTVKIMLNFLQACSVLIAFNLRWPAELRNFLTATGFAGGMASGASFIDCALKWNVYQQQVAFLVLPLAVIVVPGCIIGLLVLRHRKQVAEWKERLRESSEKDIDAFPPPPPLRVASSTPLSAFSTVSLVLLFLLYPSVTLQATRPIACIKAHGGKQFVANDMSLPCDTAEHDTFVALAFLQLVVITVGLPLLSAYIIYKRRKRLDTDSVQRRFSFLYNGYSKTAPWYETILMLKKAALVFVGSFLVGEDSSNLRIFWGLLILLSALILHLILEPFPDKAQLNLETFSIVLSVFMLLSGSVFSDEEGTNSAVNITLVTFNVTATVVFLGWSVTLASVDAWKKAKETAIGEKFAAKVAENALSRKLAATGQSAMAKIGNRISRSMSKSFRVFSGPSSQQGAQASAAGNKLVGQSTLSIVQGGSSIPAGSNRSQREQRKYSGLFGDITEMVGLNPVVFGTGTGTEMSETDAAALKRYRSLKEQVSQWRSKRHPATQTEFWYNTSARELSYTKPACVEELEVMQTDIANSWRMVPHAVGKWRMYQNSITGELCNDRPLEMPHSELEAWEVRSHPSFHVPYFVNTRTDDVAWKAPAGWVPTKAHLAEMDRISAATVDSDAESDDGLFGDELDDPRSERHMNSTAGGLGAAVANPLHSAQRTTRKASVAIPAGPQHVESLGQTYKNPRRSLARASFVGSSATAPQQSRAPSTSVAEMRSLFEQKKPEKASIPPQRRR